MANINKRNDEGELINCKWMQINDGEIVKFEEKINNPNPGQPVKVKLFLEKPLESLEREWEFNENVTSIDLSKLDGTDLKSMKRTFYGADNLAKVVLPKNNVVVDDVDVDGIIDKTDFNNVIWSGNEDLETKIAEFVNTLPDPEIPEETEGAVYKIVDNDETPWMQGEEHTLTISRVSGESEGNILTIAVYGGTTEETSYMDDEDTFEKELVIVPDSVSLKVELKMVGNVVASFEKNKIEAPEVEEPEDKPTPTPTPTPTPDPDEPEPPVKEEVKYELVDENEEWKQGEAHIVTLKRVSGEVEEANELTITCEGGEVEPTSLTDEGDETFEEELTITPDSEAIKVEVLLGGEVVAILEVDEISDENGDKEDPSEEPVEPDEKTPEEKLEEALEAGGQVEVNEPINIVEPLMVSVPGTSIVLNSNITSEKNGLVITGGTHILGEGSIKGGSGGDYSAVVIKGGADVVIEGGNYSVGPDAKGQGNSCIYVIDGNLEITGGHFETAAQWNNRYWVINRKNEESGTITIKGGEFVNFDPAHPNTDDDDTYLAEGYESVEHEGVWTVQLKQEEVEPEEPSEEPTGEPEHEKSELEKVTDALAEGGEVEIVNALEIEEPLKVTVSGTELTINNDITSAKNAIVVSADATLKGEGTVTGGSGGDYSAVVVNAGTLNIESGNYMVGSDAKGQGNSCIYVIGDGKLRISGGQFETEAMWSNRYWTINLNNSLKDVEGVIEITGGIFVGQDPANPASDDKENYLAEGYESVRLEGQINSKDAWEVKKKEVEELESLVPGE